MGGTILKNRNWDWTIVSLCRKNDSNRRINFVKACNIYGVRGIISDLDDEVLEPLDTEEIIKKIKEVIPDCEFDYVFTHGKNGEYGHIRHIEIHDAVTKMINSGDIKSKKVYFFSYGPGEENSSHDSSLKIPIAKNDSDLYIVLNKKLYKEKRDIINKIYLFEKGIFETMSCKKEEAFKLLKK
jgi:LmbE family N-acetylglucosaminyl deacetylase